MPNSTNYKKKGTVAIITLKSPPVNALGFLLRQGILDGLKLAIEDNEIKAIVLIGDGRCFSGGADIREFGNPPVNPSLQDVIECLESITKPVIAAIHETAIGGGLELVLGCHFRLGATTAKLGCPEIKLGLLPGGGATQRLPRLVGLESALDIILSGKFLSAESCLSVGLLDRVVKKNLQLEAISFAHEVIFEKTPLRVIRNFKPGKTEANATIIAAARKGIEKRSRGLIAPAHCIDAIESSFNLTFDNGLKRERELFMKCVQSEQSRAQRHAFFAERAAMRIPDIPKDVSPRSIVTAAIIGGGTMGRGIAMTFASSDIPVQIIEIDEGTLKTSLNLVKENYSRSVSRGRMDQSAMDRSLDLITGSTDMKNAGNADIVIEAIIEDLEAKKEVFRILDLVCKNEAVLASNTSTLDINVIASVTNRPHAVVGTHFFSPANIMKLMENVRGEATAKDVVATVMQLARRIGKIPVLAGVCDGFIGNRMLHAYTRQANFMLEEGALPHEVDQAIYNFGFPMGPFAMGDLAGLDVGWAIRKHRSKTRDSTERYSSIADQICELGNFGQKTGLGWYRYEKKSHKPLRDPEIENIIVATSESLGIKRRTFSEEEILERCMLTLINEGARILEEGIALRASDIDITWLYGYGFPVYRGGPMYYADQIGLDKVYDGLNRLKSRGDSSLKPAALIEKLAKEHRGFGDL